MSDSSVNPWLSDSSDNAQSGGPRIKSERMIGSIPEEPGAEAGTAVAEEPEELVGNRYKEFKECVARVGIDK